MQKDLRICLAGLGWLRRLVAEKWPRRPCRAAWAPLPTAAMLNGYFYPEGPLFVAIHVNPGAVTITGYEAPGWNLVIVETIEGLAGGERSQPDEIASLGVNGRPVADDSKEQLKPN